MENKDKIITMIDRGGQTYGVGESGDTYTLIMGIGINPWWDFVCKSPEGRE